MKCFPLHALNETIFFRGGKRQVTGSMYLLESENNYKLLVDCGLNYERDVPREANANFNFDPKLD